MEPGRAPVVFSLQARRVRASRRVAVAGEVTLAARAGEAVAVEGRNGAGKSTLLAVAAGALPLDGTAQRPATVGYAPERADVLPRLSAGRWLLGLARTTATGRADAARRVASVLARFGLEDAADRSLRTLSRGTAQRVLVAQALLGDPDLLILDEPAGGLDADGLARVSEEIDKAVAAGAVVLVSRHPSAPIPLPPGQVWWIGDGTVQVRSPRDGDSDPSSYEVETGDGVAREVAAADLDAVLRAVLDAGVGVRRVVPTAAAAVPAAAPALDPERLALSSGGGALDTRPAPLPARRVLLGAAHRARVLLADQRMVAPGLLFFLLLGGVYATDAGPALPAAAQTALALAPIVTWVGVLAHLAEGRALARVLTVHVGGRGAAHVAAALAGLPFLLAATVAAVLIPVATQPHGVPPVAVLVQMTAEHLSAGTLGIGLAALLVPPLSDRPASRILLGVLLYAGLLAAGRAGPLGPLLWVAVGATSGGADVTAAVALPAAVGAMLVALTALAAGRLP